MTAHEGPRQELWIEVPATSSAEDLARVVDEFPPGTAGRYYLVHMDLLAGRVAFGDALTERGYQVTVSEEMLRRYTFGRQQEVVYLSPAANSAGPVGSRPRAINRTVMTSHIGFPRPGGGR
jgi:hypothetical protein